MKLYHATSSANIRSIKRKGLLPAGIILQCAFIYFSDDINIAKKFGEAIIEVDTKDLNEKYLDTYREMLCDVLKCNPFYNYNLPITPDKLKFLK